MKTRRCAYALGTSFLLQDSAFHRGCLACRHTGVTSPLQDGGRAGRKTALGGGLFLLRCGFSGWRLVFFVSCESRGSVVYLEYLHTPAVGRLLAILYGCLCITPSPN